MKYYCLEIELKTHSHENATKTQIKIIYTCCYFPPVLLC